MTIEYKVHRFTDSVTECDCCGKTDLKGTFCVELDGEELYFGSVCAMKNHGVDENVLKIAKRKFLNLPTYKFMVVSNTDHKEFVDRYSKYVVKEIVEFASRKDATEYYNKHKQKCISIGDWNEVYGNTIELVNGDIIQPSMKPRFSSFWRFSGNSKNGFIALINYD